MNIDADQTEQEESDGGHPVTHSADFSEQLVKLQNVTNHLSKVASFDDLCRQAVELGRSQLGLPPRG